MQALEILKLLKNACKFLEKVYDNKIQVIVVHDTTTQTEIGDIIIRPSEDFREVLRKLKLKEVREEILQEKERIYANARRSF